MSHFPFKLDDFLCRRHRGRRRGGGGWRRTQMREKKQNIASLKLKGSHLNSKGRQRWKEKGSDFKLWVREELSWKTYATFLISSAAVWKSNKECRMSGGGRESFTLFFFFFLNVFIKSAQCLKHNYSCSFPRWYSSEPLSSIHPFS